MHIFYSPDIKENNLFLNEEESRHAVKVLRLEEKDLITIIDGKGTFYEAEIRSANPKKTEIKILGSRKEKEKDFSIHLAIAPTKNIDRIEWFVEKSIEIGIDVISFIQTEHSERKNVNLERINKIAISAVKQSQKATLPMINEVIKFKELIKNCEEEEKFIAHLEESGRKELIQTAQKKKKYCILIGPEGDFSPEEIQLAKENGFISVNLGESRLRTETAGIVACHTLNLVNSLE